MTTAQPTCRRCSECEGAEHHWIDNTDFEDEGDATHVCKHCQVLGDECEECCGLGEATCPDCKGEGVLLRKASNP